MAFRFKKFDVEDQQSSLRVGTDAMLLGAWAVPGDAARILDIGTGCGVLALMMAQKSGAIIDAIDLDLPSVNEAQGNFSRSPWKERLSAVHGTLQSWVAAARQRYDYIIANPPYFANSLRSPSARKNNARHDQSLTREELISSVTGIISAGGAFALVLPADSAEVFIAGCKANQLYLRRRLNVRPKPSFPPMRTLMEFSTSACSCADEGSLEISDSSGAFSAGYLALTADFHNF